MTDRREYVKLPNDLPRPFLPAKRPAKCARVHRVQVPIPHAGRTRRQGTMMLRCGERVLVEMIPSRAGAPRPRARRWIVSGEGDSPRTVDGERHRQPAPLRRDERAET